MKEQIYQDGFYLLIGLIIGLILGNSPRTNNPIRIKIENKDTTKSIKVVDSLSEANLKKELSIQNIPHADIVLAQAKLESGLGKSSVYKKTNNLFGLMHGKSYKKYSHWTSCVQDYKNCISSKYKGGSYYKFLEELPYAEDPEYIKKLKSLI